MDENKKLDSWNIIKEYLKRPLKKLPIPQKWELDAAIADVEEQLSKK